MAVSYHRVHLQELLDAVQEAGEQFGNLEVVFVGDDENGPFVQSHVDLVVCRITDQSGGDRQVFALMANPPDKESGERTLLQ